MMNLTFKALSDPTRREILSLLASGDRTAGEIADRFDMTKPSISHHLNILKQAKLISDVRRGQNIVYSLNTTVFQEILCWITAFSQSGETIKKEESSHGKQQ